MANDFYTANQVADLAVRLVAEDQFLSALVARNIVDPLKGGGEGRAIELDVPNALVARDRDIDDNTTDVVWDNLAESKITVGLVNAAESGVKLSDGDLSLDLKSFGKQVLVKQVDAVVERIEKAVADGLNAIPLDTAIAWDPSDPVKTFTQIRRTLRKRGVPLTGLQTVVGVDVYAALLDANLITDASQSGSTAALRDGNVGKLRGFNIVESTRVADGDIAAFHRDAFTLSVKAPVVPEGQWGQTVTADTFGLRYLRGFDMSKKATLSLVDTMFALTAMPMYSITRNYTTHAATVTQLAAGQDATFRMSTTDTEPV